MEKSEGRKKFPAKTVIILCSTIAVIYFGVTAYFYNRFLPSTMLNGIGVSGKSAEQVEEMIRKEIDGYVLSLEERGDQKEEIRGEDISLKPEFGSSISGLIDRQNAFSWPVSFFIPQELEEATMVDFDEEKLEQSVMELKCMQKENQKKPEDAHCSEYTENGYEIVPEEQGSKIKKKVLLSALKEGVSNLKDTISLEDENCYAKPGITSENEALIRLVDTLNQYTGVAITYDEEEKTETLDGSITHNWMDVADMQVSINEEKVAEYVDELASSHNTVFRKHTLKTSYGQTIDIVNGDYGWKVDKAGEKEQIIKDLKEGTSKTREITYERRGASRGENDYGNTYVEINLTAQHLFFYKNSSLVVESDFVSGNISKNYDTPTGIYGLTYKQKDAVLKGENYASPVDFWMPFCNNVGMHDASWRSSFGGGIYKTSGSHGCINLPRSAAQKIFENIEEGDPVIVYTLPGTESAAVAAAEAAQVTAMIQGIGEVTLESEPAIVMARKLYDMLSPKGQALVPNYDVLAASEAQLAALKAQASAEAAAAAAAAPPQ